MAFYKGAKRFVVLLVALTALTLIFYFSYKIFMRLAYPLKYKQLIVKAAGDHQVDKYLVLAIIREESRFKEDSVSSKGALGLMQLMPKTAKWISAQRGLSHKQAELFEPKVNIDHGSWYFSYLSKRYKKQELSLAAYNSGTSVLDRWMKANPQANLKDFVFPETRNFVARVTKTQKIYQKLYTEEDFK